MKYCTRFDLGDDVILTVVPNPAVKSKLGFVLMKDFEACAPGSQSVCTSVTVHPSDFTIYRVRLPELKTMVGTLPKVYELYTPIVQHLRDLLRQEQVVLRFLADPV